MADEPTAGAPPAPGAPNPQTSPGQAPAKVFDEGYVSRLREENAEARVSRRQAEERAAKLESEVKTLQETIAATGGTPAELAALKRRVDELTASQKQAQDEKQQERSLRISKQLDADLSMIAASTLETERGHAARLLRTYAEVDADGVTVFNVEEDGKAVKVPATLENAKKYKLLSSAFFPPRGVPGTGFRPTAAEVAGGIDLDRARTDQAYFEKNFDAVMAAKKAGA